jgi:choline dehydrogenase-like flavoprotein
LSLKLHAESVLVIEYGYLRDNDSIILLPASSTTGSRAEDQFYITSVPQPGLNNQTGVLRAGAVVGGSSAVNGQFFDRASSEDYDDWARLGNLGWDWNGLLPYFKKVRFSFRVIPNTN